MSVRKAIAILVLALALAAGGLALWLTSRTPRTAPPRANDPLVFPSQTSMIAVPVEASLADLGRALEREVPRALWTIDKPDQVCVASKKVKVLFAKIKTPTIKCRLVGQVTRGRLRLSGTGQTIVVAIPIHAVISARDIAGILKRETATADAMVRARIRLDLDQNWSPRGTVSIDYAWTDNPHIDFLGQRVELTSKADAKLKGVIRHLERTLPHELRKLAVREQIAKAWQSAFTSFELNEANPPVWMRITPRQLQFGGYDVRGDRLTLRLGMTALTETFVGPRPADPPAAALPSVSRFTGAPGIVRFAIPVIADYHELEPVLLRALVKRSARPFAVPGLDPVTAQFGAVTVYGTTGGKIAVGLDFTAVRPGGSPSRGTVWLTALPISQPDSRQVSFGDLTVAGITDTTRSSLLLKLANTPVLSETLAAALTQNFTKDYDRLLQKIGTALSEKRIGDVVIRAHITGISTGRLKATGRGVYLPVAGQGTATITIGNLKRGVVATGRSSGRRHSRETSGSR